MVAQLNKLGGKEMQVAAVLGRAYAATQHGIRYKLGKGGFNPGLATPGQNGQCDCTGFASWCFGISRQTRERFYLQFNGGWIETTAVWTDCGAPVGMFEAISTPRPGAVVVYPDANGQQGHIAIVVDEDRIVHCSAGNDRQFGNAIQVTAPTPFTNHPTTRIGWLTGLQ